MIKLKKEVSYFIIINQSPQEWRIAMEAIRLWNADLENGTYRNPILHADYSDPDAIRFGETYYMTASSFNYTPGLPILRSYDLVNWELVNYAIENIDYPDYKIPQHSKGVWAPSIRFHEGCFYIFYGMPDEGIFMVKAKDPLGKWEKPVLVLEGKGLIDPCPLWDDDGHAYIVHAYAKSRAGFNSVLGVFEMTWDGCRAISRDRLVFDGTVTQKTIEGPKLYKRDGWYYIFAPAGGVPQGWQTALRSKEIYGPYEEKIVLRQGDTPVNGPHQGALVDTQGGEEWFLHFQDRGAYGRIIHLQPVIWQGGWPVIGRKEEGEDCGKPCLFHKKPALPETKNVFLRSSDDFSQKELALQWQWLGNHEDTFYSLKARKGYLRLYSQNPSGQEPALLWNCSNVLTQKLLCPDFHMDVKMEYAGLDVNEQAGIIVIGQSYAWLGVARMEGGIRILYVHALEDAGGMREIVKESILMEDLRRPIWFRVKVSDGAEVTAEFSFSRDGVNYQTFPDAFVLQSHTWVGAKTGMFAVAQDCAKHQGYADFAYAKYHA